MGAAPCITMVFYSPDACVLSGASRKTPEGMYFFRGQVRARGPALIPPYLRRIEEQAHRRERSEGGYMRAEEGFPPPWDSNDVGGARKGGIEGGETSAGGESAPVY